LLHPIFLLPDPPPTEIYTLSLHDALPISWMLNPSESVTIRKSSGTSIVATPFWNFPRPVKYVPALGPSRETYRITWEASVGCLRSEEHTSELQSRGHLVCRLLLEKKK